MDDQLLLKENFVFPIKPGFNLVEDKLNKENFCMSLTIDFPDEWDMYRLCEKKETDEKKTYYDEHSKIRFLTYHNFPDGVFIQKRENHSYKIFIFELKRNAKNRLVDIPKQLHSGVIHAISLINLLETDTNSNVVAIQPNLNIEYEMFVYSGEMVELPQYNRPIPGNPTNKNNRLIDFVNRRVYHNLKNKKNYVFSINTLESTNKKKVKDKQYYYSNVSL